jgi:transposase
MSHEIRADYQTRLLFPLCLEDWLDPDDPARYIREFVDTIDLSAFGLTEEQEIRRHDPNGRPHYAVDLLLKIWLYGYMYKIRSSRELEKHCRKLVPLIWLAGRHEPDHNTLWRFWKRYRPMIRELFLRSVRVAMDAGLVGMVMQAVDGTKIHSAGSSRSAWHKADLKKVLNKVEKEIETFEQQIAEAGEEGGGADDRIPQELQKQQDLRARIQEALAELEKAEREHMHPLDPEARMMVSHGRTPFAYNAQAMVDQKNGIIVAADVTDQENDEHQLKPMLEQTKQNTGDFAETTVADSGYNTAEGLGAAEQMKADVLVALKQTKRQVEPYHSMHFTYDEATDSVQCPQDQTLSREGTRNHKDKPYPVQTYRCRVSASCPVAAQCSSDRRGRVIEISPHHAAVVRNREHPNARALLRQRQMVVERAFAEIKETLGLRRWTVRGLLKVQTQWTMMCAGMNLRRMIAARAG